MLQKPVQSQKLTPKLRAGEKDKPQPKDKQKKDEMDDKDMRSTITSPKSKKKKRRKRRDPFDISGVTKITLTEFAQKLINCKVGIDVTSQSPWKYVKKEIITDDLELHELNSEFLPVKKQILEYPREEVLMGYIADETVDRDDEDFYICLTEDATDTVAKIIDQLQREQDERLHYQLFKDINPWTSLGSEVEIDETVLKDNRALIEVEVETRYPIFPDKVQFRYIKAEEKRDGYVELKCEENVPYVYRKRIHSAIQAAPPVISTEVQTDCAYPSNAACQYLYDPGPVEDLLLQCKPRIINYTNLHMDNLSNILQVSGWIDFHKDDYNTLIRKDILSGDAAKLTVPKEYLENMSFMDVDLAQGKMISDIYWHRMWSGIVAISYCDVSPIIFFNGCYEGDEVDRAIYTPNLVLIWSFLDALKPKLILESPREIYKLSFCKFDENILIGGCKNGQIIIWDIRNRLQKVEQKEVLNAAQQKYRSYMFEMMGWMKNNYDVAVVRPTAVSDMRFSHRDEVSGISWMDPHYEFSRTGQINEVETDEDGNPKYSMQLVTSGLDGNILVWDLKMKPMLVAGSYKVRKLKRLKERPEALQSEASPYRVLHLNLKPKYRITILEPNVKSSIPICITKSSIAYCYQNYVEINPTLPEDKKKDFDERYYYKPVLTKPPSPKPILGIGTVEGDYAEITWEGQDFDSGETVNSELGKFIYSAKYHDGPITTINKSRETGVTLTVGGKIFALWRDDFPQRPILWRKNRFFYTKGELNMFHSFRIITQAVNGVIARWILPISSKKPVFTQVISNSYLTASHMYPFLRDRYIYGLGDEQGSFRLFHIKKTSFNYPNTIANDMNIFIEKEIHRKKTFLQWQEEFNLRNEEYQSRLKAKADKRAKEEAAAREARGDEHKTVEKASKRGPEPGKYVEWITEQRQIKEEARIRAMIINKKQLDTKELEKRRKPLQKLDEENARKKKKQRERLKQGKTIFDDQVEALFPAILRKKTPPPQDPYAGGDSDQAKQNVYQQYREIVEKMDRFVVEHPFRYTFNFKNLLVDSRTKDDIYLQMHEHKNRYESEKRIRKGDESVQYFDENEEELELKEPEEVEDVIKREEED